MTPAIKDVVYSLIRIQVQLGDMARRLSQAEAEAAHYAHLAQGISDRPAYSLPKGEK